MKAYSILDNVVFLDIETTGLDSTKDKIIEIGAVKIKDKMITRFNTLVNPNRSVPLNILDLCSGISQIELDTAPQLEDVMKELLVFVEDLPLVCHNANFEKSFLNLNNDFLDSLELIAILFPELPEYNLQYLIKKFLPNYKDEKHRGLSDSEDTIEVLNYAISSFYGESGYIMPMSIIDLEAWSWHKYLTSVDMKAVKYFLEDKPLIIENKIVEPYPVFALKDYEKLFETKAIWTRNGRNYSLRVQQRDASKYIREGLENEKITIMEAPTGLGKSMAYLLPSAIFTHLKEEKIIISTNTKGLQNQLVEKDIPNLLESLNLKRDVNYTLIKGKSNYLCYERFQDIEIPMDMKTRMGYVYLNRLITEKGLGDIEEINYVVRERFNLNFLLEQCFCDPELCEVDSCRHKEKCYYASKVEALKEAQLIVVNHSLLLKWPYQTIAPLENIVLDEAHNLTQEAYDAFENSIVSSEFEKFLKDIYNSKEKSGYLFYLSKKVKKDTMPLEEIEKEIEFCNVQIMNVKLAFEEYVTTSGISREYNIKEHLNKSNPKLLKVAKQLEYFKENLASLNLNLDKAISVLKAISSLEKDTRLKILMEKLEDINNYIRLLEDVIFQVKEDYCFYFEIDRHFQWWKISSIPLDVSGIFYEKVLNSAKSCLFISATLATNKNYDSFKNTLGINIAKSKNKEIIEVPPIKPVFDYKGKSAVYALQSSDPNDAEAFSEELKEFVLELLNNVEGNIIMLFTSRKRLMTFKNVALGSLNSLGVRVIEMKKDIEKLKSREERYIFLGSKGYFEGIDIAGDTMTTVILDKLPNINSKEPFYKSLIENHVEKGAKYWQAYAKVNYPIVSIDLKQIYGRLIRTEYDYGSLFIMSKFDKSNSTVRKLENQLHEVPIIRTERQTLFKDLKVRQIRWKQINLYKIMKEVKENLRESIVEKRRLNEITSLKAVDNFINEFMSLEYEKRKLKYDINISLTEEVKIFISGDKLDLGKNKVSINQYFKDILKET